MSSFFSLSSPKDVNAGEGSEFADSGIEGTTTDTDLLSRRSNATNSSYSPPTGRAFVGSDSGSSSTGDAARQGVYENFRRELEMSTTNSESLEEAGSAHSDEQSSGTLSSPGQSDILLTAAQGTVRKAGALAVKNFLVHKKNKKVESATRRKWKHYWVSLKGKSAPHPPVPDPAAPPQTHPPRSTGALYGARRQSMFFNHIKFLHYTHFKK